MKNFLEHLSPLAFFPIMAVVLILFDTVLGDRTMLEDLALSHRREVGEKLISDYFQSLLPAIVCYTVVFIPLRLLSRDRPMSFGIFAYSIGCVVFTIAIYLAMPTPSSISLVFIATVFIAWCLCIFTLRFLESMVKRLLL